MSVSPLSIREIRFLEFEAEEDRLRRLGLTRISSFFIPGPLPLIDPNADPVVSGEDGTQEGDIYVIRIAAHDGFYQQCWQ